MSATARISIPDADLRTAACAVAIREISRSYLDIVVYWLMHPPWRADTLPFAELR